MDIETAKAIDVGSVPMNLGELCAVMVALMVCAEVGFAPPGEALELRGLCLRFSLFIPEADARRKWVLFCQQHARDVRAELRRAAERKTGERVEAILVPCEN